MQIILERTNETELHLSLFVNGEQKMSPPSVWKRTLMNAAVMIELSKSYWAIAQLCTPNYYPQEGPIIGLKEEGDLIAFDLNGEELPRMPSIFDLRNQNFDALIAARCGTMFLVAAEQISEDDSVAF